MCSSALTAFSWQVPWALSENLSLGQQGLTALGDCTGLFKSSKSILKTLWIFLCRGAARGITGLLCCSIQMAGFEHPRSEVLKKVWLPLYSDLLQHQESSKCAGLVPGGAQGLAGGSVTLFLVTKLQMCFSYSLISSYELLLQSVSCSREDVLGSVGYWAPCSSVSVLLFLKSNDFIFFLGKDSGFFSYEYICTHSLRCG